MNSSATIAPEPNNLLQYPINAFKQKPPNGIGGGAAATANVPVSANTKPSSSNADSSFYKKIVWRKDGEKLQMDASINIRQVIHILSLIHKNHNFHRQNDKTFFWLCHFSSSPGWLSSRLSILGAERQHSGSYSCLILNSTSAMVDVQILNGKPHRTVKYFSENYCNTASISGETPAAVQHSCGNILGSMAKYLRLILLILPLLYISC